MQRDTIDTHLGRTGFSDAQTRALGDILGEIFETMLTKDDLRRVEQRLEHRLAEAEQRLEKTMVRLQLLSVAAIAAVVALVEFRIV